MNRTKEVPETPQDFAEYLEKLRADREQQKAEQKKAGIKRGRPTSEERELVLSKTGGRCHVCGGGIELDSYWEADHVLGHDAGGSDDVENYLPAHRICNNYRWDYSPTEFEEILRLGVWLRTQIERQSKVGKEAAERFVKYEQGRIGRRKKKG